MIDKLLHKKVKLDNNIDLSIIIEKLNEFNIHTAYISNKTNIHSLFFKEYETLFILSNKSSADVEFKDADYEEMSFKNFTDILGINIDKTPINECKCTSMSNKLDKFIRIIGNEDDDIIVNVSKITYIKYKKETIIISMDNNENITANNVNKEAYLKTLNFLNIN